MITPINGLQNMEMMLYGGSTAFNGAPSMHNNYCAQPVQQTNPFYGNYAGYPQTYANYGYQYPQTQQSVQQAAQLPQTYANWGSQSIPQQATTFNGLTQKETQAITDFYAKNLEPSESFKSALFMGGIFGAMTVNPRSIVHPWNFVKASVWKDKTTGVNELKEMFKGVKDPKDPLHKLWKEHSHIMEEAYAQTHRARSRSYKKLGLFRARYTDVQYKKLMQEMQKALATGNIDEIAKATEALRYAYCRNGKIFQGIDWVRTKIFRQPSKLQDPLEMLKNTAEIDKNAATLIGRKNMTFGKAFEKAGGKLGLAFGAIEILMNMGKIQTAFQKDKEDQANGIKDKNLGWKQLGQTTVKAAANAGGWMLGETAAIWAWSKAGASIGTAVGPGVGTLIGAVVGFVGGSLSMWLAGRATKAIVGEDVANKIEAEKMAKTEEGQTELLKTALEAVKKGQPMDGATQAALQKAMQYEMQKAQQQQAMQQQVAYPQQLSYMA